MKNTLCMVMLIGMCLGCRSNEANTPTNEVMNETNDIKQNSHPTESKPYFTANGTDPFWILEISEEFIKYKTPSDSILIPYVKPIVAQDSNVKRYTVETESGNMSIQVSQTDCNNGMSGIVYPYSVSIDYKKSTESQSEQFKGCGHYVTDYRLQDIWVLETLNGNTVSKSDFSKELPSMELNATENTFIGFAGCNRMNGQLFFEKGLLRFTKIATTMKMCMPDNKEDEFLKALRSSIRYSIETNRLTLSNPSGNLVVFKKVD